MNRRIARVLSLALVPVLLTFAGPSHAQEPISFGQPIQQQLDITDPVTPDGIPFDAYTFTAEQGQSYVITGNSSELPLFIGLYRADDTEALTLVQAAYVGAAGRQVQFSGDLEETGSYLLIVQSTDPTLLGAYTVSLDEQAPAGGCAAGTRGNPVPIDLGASLSCELTTDDVQFGNPSGQTFYGKFFRFESSGEEATITVESDEITPFIQVYADLEASGVVEFGEGTVTIQYPAGPVLFAVINIVPEAVGAFTVSVSPSGAASP